MTQEETMTAQEVCKELGISIATLNRWVKNDVLQPVPPRTSGYKKVPVRKFKRVDVEKLKNGEST